MNISSSYPSGRSLLSRSANEVSECRGEAVKYLMDEAVFVRERPSLHYIETSAVRGASILCSEKYMRRLFSLSVSVSLLFDYYTRFKSYTASLLYTRGKEKEI